MGKPRKKTQPDPANADSPDSAATESREEESVVDSQDQGCDRSADSGQSADDGADDLEKMLDEVRTGSAASEQESPAQASVQYEPDMASGGQAKAGDSTTKGGDPLDENLVDDRVAAFGREDADLNPQTCCSNCQTIFEVSLDLLSSSDTRVRCGECLSIFDALANLRDNDNIDDDLLMDLHGSASEAGNDSIRPGSVRIGDSGVAAGLRRASGLPDAGAASLAGLARDDSALDVTYSDFELFSAEAGLPEVAYFDQTQDTSQFDFDELADDENDETFSDTLFAQDVTVDARSALRDSQEADDAYDLHNIALDSDVDYIADEGPHESLVFNYQERETRHPGQTSAQSQAAGGHTATARTTSATHNEGELPSAASSVNDSLGAVTLEDKLASQDAIEPRMMVAEQPVGSWWFRSILFLIVLSIAAALYGYRERDTLQHNQYLRPLLDHACRVLNCTLSEQVDLSALKVLKRTVFSHPNLDNVLIINVGFVNEADFAQRYPILEIRLTDRNGRLVVKNNFEPADYLDSWQQGDVLDVDKRLDISLNVEDPGRTAMSFELDFR